MKSKFENHYSNKRGRGGGGGGGRPKSIWKVFIYFLLSIFYSLFFFSLSSQFGLVEFQYKVLTCVLTSMLTCVLTSSLIIFSLMIFQIFELAKQSFGSSLHLVMKKCVGRYLYTWFLYYILYLYSILKIQYLFYFISMAKHSITDIFKLYTSGT